MAMDEHSRLDERLKLPVMPSARRQDRPQVILSKDNRLPIMPSARPPSLIHDTPTHNEENGSTRAPMELELVTLPNVNSHRNFSSYNKDRSRSTDRLTELTDTIDDEEEEDASHRMRSVVSEFINEETKEDIDNDDDNNMADLFDVVDVSSLGSVDHEDAQQHGELFEVELRSSSFSSMSSTSSSVVSPSRPFVRDQNRYVSEEQISTTLYGDGERGSSSHRNRKHVNHDDKNRSSDAVLQHGLFSVHTYVKVITFEPFALIIVVGTLLLSYYAGYWGLSTMQTDFSSRMLVCATLF
jgi:hypothetical protein